MMESCLQRLIGITRKSNKTQPHQIRTSYLLCVATFLIAVSPAALSDLYTYSYRGNNYVFAAGVYDSSMSLRGEFVLDSDLEPNLTRTQIDPIKFSFFDGVNTLNETNTRLSYWSTFEVSTDNQGNIIGWYIYIREEATDYVGSTFYSISTDNRLDEDDQGGIFTCFQIESILNENICTGYRTYNYGTVENSPGDWTVSVVSTAPVDISGTIKTINDLDVCAMVLASGQFMFSCNPQGEFSLNDLPRENDGTVKRQIYADGFFPKMDILRASSDDAVVMKRSGTCPRYNTPYDQSFVPGSAGKRIYISGTVLIQNSQTPICAMVLANGKHTFSCNSTGSYALNIPLDNNGQFKLQVYADGSAPMIQTFDEFSTVNVVRMARAAECQAP